MPSDLRRALLSVSDKTGLVDFATGLRDLGVEMLSTGGTARALADAGLPVIPVEDVTGFPEMMDGRVKTLHPRIHGGILARRDIPGHMEKLKEHDIAPIDIVVVNLYPFKQTISKPDCTFEDAIENIDIGGPTMLRSAAKNFASVSVIIDPSDYKMVLDDMKNTNGEVSKETNFKLAVKVFETTSDYDRAITDYLQKKL